MTTWALLAVCFLLALLLLLPYQDTLQIDLLQRDHASKERVLPISSEQAVSENITQYLAIMRSPLFNADRTQHNEKKEASISESVPVVSPQLAAKKSDLPKLIGVMTVSNVEMAFVISSKDSEPVGLRVGESYRKWTLKVIEPTQIIMSYNENEETISLDWTLKNMLHNLTEKDKSPKQQQSVISTEHGKAPISLKDKLARTLKTN